MKEKNVIQFSRRNIEHEGKKTPIKGYTWDELDEIEVEDSFDVANVKEASRAHTLLHWAWNDRALPGWHYDEILAEHARVVKFLVDRGERHVRVDSLDTTLPDDLKEKSTRPERDLTYVRTINYYHKKILHEAGVDSIRKLAKADPDELVEGTGFSRDYVEYIQKRAEEM